MIPAGVLEDYEDLDYSGEDGRLSVLLELVPPEHAEIIIESDEHVRFRRPLSDLVAADQGWRTYEVDIQLTRAPEY